MASESKIKFSLSSDYDGKGFQAGLKALEDTSKASAKASDGVQKLAFAAQQVNGPIGEASQKVSGFAGTLKNVWTAVANLPGPLKIVALAVASLGTGIKIGMDIAAKRAEEAKERIERAANALQAGIKSRLSWLRNKMDEDLAAMRDGIKNTIAEFDKLIGRVNKVNSAKAQVTVAEASGRMAQLNSQRAQELAGIADENERAILQARWAERMALEERNEIIRQNTANEKEADRNLKNAQDRRTMLEELVGEAKKAVAVAEEDAAQAAKTGTKDLKPFNERVQKARENLATVEEQLKDQNIAVTVAQENRKAILQQGDNALVDNETKLVELSEATQRLIDATEKNAKAKEENAEKTKLQSSIMGIQAETAAKVAGIDKQIEQAKQNIEDISKAQDRTRMGMDKDKQVHRGIGGEGYKYETGPDGLPSDLAGWERAQRYAQRADRDNARSNRAATANERELKKLNDKLEKGQRLTDNERKKLDKLKAWDDERNGKQRQEEAIRKAEEAKKKLQEEANKAIKDIRDKIDALTIK